MFTDEQLKKLVLGNALLIYVFQLGVAGAGFSTLFSRVLSVGAICVILLKKGDVPVKWQMRVDWGIMRRILYIGIPNGLENSIFQMGKILASSLIAGFGTASITANAVVGSVGNFQLIPTNAVGMAMITVVGQCVGAGEYAQTRKYLYKLLKAAYVFVMRLVFDEFREEMKTVAPKYGLEPEKDANYYTYGIGVGGMREGRISSPRWRSAVYSGQS